MFLALLTYAVTRPETYGWIGEVVTGLGATVFVLGAVWLVFGRVALPARTLCMVAVTIARGATWCFRDWTVLDSVYGYPRSEFPLPVSSPLAGIVIFHLLLLISTLGLFRASRSFRGPRTDGASAWHRATGWLTRGGFAALLTITLGPVALLIWRILTPPEFLPQSRTAIQT